MKLAPRLHDVLCGTARPLAGVYPDRAWCQIGARTDGEVAAAISRMAVLGGPDV